MHEELSFSEEEHGKLQFESVDGTTSWKEGAVEDKDILFGPKALQLTRDALQALDSAKQLHPEHISLWEKFMEDNDTGTEDEGS